MTDAWLKSTTFEDKQAWHAALDRTLKREKAYQSLMSKTIDGIDIAPLYQAYDRISLAQSPTHSPPTTHFRQLIDDPSLERAKKALNADIEGGASHFLICHTSTSNSLASGLNTLEPNTLTRLFKPIDMSNISLRLDAGIAGLQWCNVFVQWFHHQKRGPLHWSFSPALSPTTMGLINGAAIKPDEIAQSYALFKELSLSGYKDKFFAADSRLYHAAGASEVQELALLIAEMAERLREAENHNLEASKVFNATVSLIAVDNDLWLNVAKLRAARQLISHFTALCGFHPKSPPRLEADLSPRMFTRIDTMNNVLRATLACAAAQFANVDSFTLIAHSAACGVPNLEARRLIRNLALIARDEANLSHVIDPLSGSGAIETLTDQLAERAWHLFQTIEKEGGLSPWIASGKLTSALSAVREKRANLIATKAMPITSVSMFANRMPEEPMIEKDDDNAPAKQALSKATPVLSLQRLSEPFEELRARSETLSATIHITIVTLGSSAEHRSQLQQIENMLAIAGLNDTHYHQSSLEQALEQDKESPSSLIIIASNTDNYTVSKIHQIAELKSKTQNPIWCSGEPALPIKQELQKSGLTNFVGVKGENLITLLNAMLDILQLSDSEREGVIS